MLRSSQVLAIALIVAGIFGLYHEPLPASDALISIHKIHYYAQLGLIVAGLVFFDPWRFGKGISSLVELVKAWRVKP